jgi:hypothetical protein
MYPQSLGELCLELNEEWIRDCLNIIVSFSYIGAYMWRQVAWLTTALGDSHRLRRALYHKNRGDTPVKAKVEYIYDGGGICKIHKLPRDDEKWCVLGNNGSVRGLYKTRREARAEARSRNNGPYSWKPYRVARANENRGDNKPRVSLSPDIMGYAGGL